MPIPTEQIGSIPRPKNLLQAIQRFNSGEVSNEELDAQYEAALKETVLKLEETGAPIISDGEQSKPSFATYPLQNLDNLSSDGVTIFFSDGHVRQLPRITSGPFKYAVYAKDYLLKAQTLTDKPIKQAVISASALSLMYPQDGIESYPRGHFLADLIDEAENDIRGCLDNGAHRVQVDFTEGRLSVKLDPSKQLLRSFVDLNNLVFERFSEEERKKIGVHTCPGGDIGSTHSADVDYAELLPLLFELKVGNFYVQMSTEQDKERIFNIIKDNLKPEQRVFIGVVDPINSQIETPEEVKVRVLEAAKIIPVHQLGTTDDCGFSPFADDVSMSREIAFAKIKARIEGTAMASRELGV